MKTAIAFMLLASSIQASEVRRAKVGERLSADGIVPSTIITRQRAGEPLRYYGPPIEEPKRPAESKLTRNPYQSPIPSKYAIPRLPTGPRKEKMGKSTMRGSTKKMRTK